MALTALGAGALAMAAAPGCSTEETVSEPQLVLVGIDGVTISEVAIYQGAKRTLSANGVPVASDTPLVTGRDALLRVFYQTAPGLAGKAVTGRLEITGHAPIDAPAVLGAGSVEGDLASTIDFDIPGDHIADPFDYRLSILELGTTDHPAGHYPAAGSESHVVDGPENTLRIVLTPFAYDFDGSGRTPDLSPERVELYRQRFLQLYPVSNVEVTVRAPEPWNQAIQPDGTGWQEVGFRLLGIRNAEAPSQDYYYFGIFNPSASLASYCPFGCLLGVTLLNDQPADVGNPQLRLALGVGYNEVAADTMAHEIGHAHGREHVNCGGPDPQSIDPNYPYNHSTIGSWGWDIVGGGLIDPALYSDIMGYCNSQWISDYNFAALLRRGKNVNLPRWQAPPAEVLVPTELVMVDGAGGAVWKGPVPMSARPTKGTVPVRLTRADDSTLDVLGELVPYDHLPGGWLLFPAQTEPVKRAEIALGPKPIVVER